MSSPIPVIALGGAPFEKGLAHGRALRAQIRDFSASVVAVHQENNAFLKVDRSSLHAFCLRNLGFLQRFSPQLVEEMKGIAKGAGLPFEDILMLNSFLELEDLRAPSLGGKALPDALWGCTSFNVPGPAAASGRPLIGQTYDMEKYYEKYLALLRIDDPEGPSQLIVTLAGIVGLNGINSEGIGAVINKIVATDARPGVIYPFIMREALASRRIGDALGKAIFSSRASGLNYQFSGQGITFCAETSATRYELLDCTGGLAHTNHYVGREMRQFETPNWLSHGGSMVRKQKADLFLARHSGKITPELLKELTCDHTNYPRSICAHGFPDEGENTAFHTIFAVVISPEQGWLEICTGSPCKNGYHRFLI
ncbi:acyl-coenzyme A:6-aminopenicillanic acid acyl-transferase [delta proteobacterium NaphS2]|nr:acyl-coenzyme A:6-aminopenicillanic acid acyl-transferase [delta proteobacterium NaphS2]